MPYPTYITNQYVYYSDVTTPAVVLIAGPVPWVVPASVLTPQLITDLDALEAANGGSFPLSSVNVARSLILPNNRSWYDTYIGITRFVNAATLGQYNQTTSVQSPLSVEPVLDLLTDGGTGPNRRLRVDVGQTGFFASREFRTYFEFSISAAASATLKMVLPCNIILMEQRLNLDAGRIRLTESTGGSESGTFNVPITVTRKNQMTDAPTPLYTPQVTLSSGGTHTGGLINDIIRCSAAQQGQAFASVGDTNDSDRGWAPGVRYFDLQNIGTVTATGVFTLSWEERP